MATACQDAHGLMSGNNASAEQRETEFFNSRKWNTNDGNQRYNQQNRLCTVFYYPFYETGTLWRYVRKRNIVYPWHFDAMANIMISATMENLFMLNFRKQATIPSAFVRPPFSVSVNCNLYSI